MSNVLISPFFAVFLALGACKPNSISNVESSISERTTALYNLYASVGNSNEFLKSLEETLDAAGNQVVSTLPKSGQIGTFVFNDFDKRVQSLVTNQPAKFKGSMRSVLKMSNHLSKKITIQDFQLAENYLADNLKAAGNKAAAQAVAKKYTPSQVMRATHAIAVIGALPVTKAGSDNLGLLGREGPASTINAAANAITATGGGISDAARAVGATTVCGNLQGFGCGKAQQGYADRVNDKNNMANADAKCQRSATPEGTCNYGIARRNNGQMNGNGDCRWVTFTCSCAGTWDKTWNKQDNKDEYVHKDDDSGSCSASMDRGQTPPPAAQLDKTAVELECTSNNAHRIVDNCTGGNWRN